MVPDEPTIASPVTVPPDTVPVIVDEPVVEVQTEEGVALIEVCIGDGLIVTSVKVLNGEQAPTAGMV
jgi:hypothetical protein